MTYRALTIAGTVYKLKQHTSTHNRQQSVHDRSTERVANSGTVHTLQTSPIDKHSVFSTWHTEHDLFSVQSSPYRPFQVTMIPYSVRDIPSTLLFLVQVTTTARFPRPQSSAVGTWHAVPSTYPFSLQYTIHRLGVLQPFRAQYRTWRTEHFSFPCTAHKLQ